MEQLKKDFSTILGISFGIFLFILFFQPFPLDYFDFNNRLIFVAGLGAIIFVSMMVVKILFALWFPEETTTITPILPSLMSGLSILAISSVAFAFYLRYVGKVPISFYVMVKIILVCSLALVVFRIFDVIKTLKQHNENLIKEKKSIQKQVERYEEDYLNQSVVLTSENGAETLELPIAEIACMKSADNYVEIIYREGDSFRKKLLRTTLKGIEKQIKEHTNFTRCHRICIVNSHFIEKLSKNYNTHWISIKGYDEKIPVSRQYLLKIKEVV